MPSIEGPSSFVRYATVCTYCVRYCLCPWGSWDWLVVNGCLQAGWCSWGVSESLPEAAKTHHSAKLPEVGEILTSLLHWLTWPCRLVHIAFLKLSSAVFLCFSVSSDMQLLYWLVCDVCVCSSNCPPDWIRRIAMVSWQLFLCQILWVNLF